MPVEEALSKIVTGVKPTAIELVKLSDAHGRVLARDLRARRDQPPFPASAMDGYAVRADDLADLPVRLTLKGISAAGHGFASTVQRGEAVRILTGAPVPKGADAIVVQENTEIDARQVIILSAPRQGQHIRARGLDFRRGDVLLRAGKRLNARDLGIAAATNVAALPVRRRPRVAVFATGDELVRPGAVPGPSQIISSNTAAIAALVEQFGGVAQDLGIVRDSLAATLRTMERARGFDIVLSTGGASVGDHDFVYQAFQKAGVRLGFWKVAMRPGKPLVFGTRGRQRILGLPGNPVSALVCARLFLKPLLDACLGLAAEDPLIPARLGTPLKQNDSRQDYVRAKLARTSDGVLVATPYEVQDSSMQRTLAEAGAFIVRKPHAPALAAGAVVDVMPIDF
jgi:molybdopterin molybdotransferase